VSGKLPPDALAYYVALGPSRSYAAVAAHFGVAKRTVTRQAVKEDWPGEIERIEAEARTRTREAAVETLAEMNARHLKLLKVVAGKALETLRQTSLGSGAAAVRALDLVLRHERAALTEVPEARGGGLRIVLEGLDEAELPGRAPGGG